MASLKPAVLTADAGIAAILRWSEKGRTPAEYQVFRNGTRIATLAGTVTSYTDTGVVAGTTYSYYVRSFAGFESTTPFSSVVSNTVSVTVPVVPVPTTASVLTGTAGSSQVSLSWTPVLNADSYTLQRKAGAGAYADVVSQVGLTYLNTGLTNGTAYTFRVKGTSHAGTNSGPWSNEVTKTPASTVPVAPTLTGTAGDSENTLDWNSVANAATYRVRVSVNGAAAVQLVETAATDYVHDTAINDTSYAYSVRGVAADGTLGALSNTLTLIPTAASPSPAPTPVGLFIHPDGSDSNAGTIDAPMKTILAASAKLVPGQTLWMRGGNYYGQGGYNWKKSGLSGAPVTLKAYPGELPVIDGQGTVSHGIIISGYSWVVIDGIKITRTGMGTSGDGAILLLNASNITIRNCQLINNGIGFQQDHSIYINSGCSFLTIEDNTFHNTPGGHIHAYHPPGPTDVVIQRNAIGNPAGDAAYWGVVIGDTCTGAARWAINNNVFRNCDVNIDSQGSFPNVTASGNDPNNTIT